MEANEVGLDSVDDLWIICTELKIYNGLLENNIKQWKNRMCEQKGPRTEPWGTPTAIKMRKILNILAIMKLIVASEV